MSALDKTAMVLVVIGALNWGLVGALNVDLVDVVSSALSGSDDNMRQTLNKVIYILVGLAAIYVAYKKLSQKK
jgi:uncharacterized membrane protein YuzA (DUF378 family)